MLKNRKSYFKYLLPEMVQVQTYLLSKVATNCGEPNKKYYRPLPSLFIMLQIE